MINKLLIGSNNDYKISEIKEIFNKNDFKCDLIRPIDLNCKNEPVEDGISFKENAYLKAKFYYDLYHLPCVGEDSGICISYLNDLPGIHSKRFLQDFDNVAKNNKILEIMKGIKNRKTVFITSLCYIDELGDVFYFEGLNKGEIALKQEGLEGFGYDPIFLIPELNKTEAQLGNDYKNEHSHRAKAFKEFINYVQK